MDPLLIASIVIITLALIFYSIGVLGEFRRKFLEKRDALWFGAGLLCDTTGTFIMNRISTAGGTYLSPTADFLMNISGSLALLLMLLHLLIALILLRKNVYRDKFHTVSIVIWAFWLIAYILGPIGLMIG